MEVLTESSTNYIFSERSDIGLSKNVTTRLMPLPGGKVDIIQLGMSSNCYENKNVMHFQGIQVRKL